MPASISTAYKQTIYLTLINTSRSFLSSSNRQPFMLFSIFFSHVLTNEPKTIYSTSSILKRLSSCSSANIYIYNPNSILLDPCDKHYKLLPVFHLPLQLFPKTIIKRITISYKCWCLVIRSYNHHICITRIGNSFNYIIKLV